MQSIVCQAVYFGHAAGRDEATDEAVDKEDLPSLERLRSWLVWRPKTQKENIMMRVVRLLAVILVMIGMVGPAKLSK